MELIDIKKFTQFTLPEVFDIVYIFCFKRHGQGDNNYIPFYVGESSRSIGRFGDYLSAKFSAATDFKVGHASRHFRKLGFEVSIFYKNSTDRRIEEDDLIENFRKDGIRLLNDFPGYNYITANQEEVLIKIREYVFKVLKKHKYNNKWGAATRVLTLPSKYRRCLLLMKAK